MKKIYQKPVSETFKVNIKPLMDASPVNFNNDGTGGVNPIETDATGEAMSRRRDIWDD